MKKIFTIGIAVSFLLLAAVPAARAHAFAGGDGSSGDPYQVASCADFESVMSHSSSDFIMTADIDCTGDGNGLTQAGAGFFFGDFNGQGHKLTYATTTTGAGGSWAVWEELAGGTVENLWVDGTVTDDYGSNNLGGLFYAVADGTLSNIKSTVTIAGSGTGTGNVGGIVSIMAGGTVKNSYFDGTIDIDVPNVGGIAGMLDDAMASIENSYAAGSVTGANTGGLAGIMNDGEIIHSFGAAAIDGADGVSGGLVGSFNGGAILDSWWDSYASGQSGCTGGTVQNCSEVDGSSEPNYFKGNHDNDPLSHWDFNGTWRTESGAYPELAAFAPVPAPTMHVHHSSHSGGGGGGSPLPHVCMDEKASNYQTVGVNDPSVCTYAGASAPAAGSAAPAFQFAKNLRRGMADADIMLLQKFLNSRGFPVAASGAGSAGMETNYFGPGTQAALAKYQSAHGIAPAAGFCGPLTRAALNAGQ